MAIREMVTCERCGKTEPVTLRTRIDTRRLFYGERGGIFGFTFTKHIDLCESCWKDFEQFVYRYKADER